MEYYIEPAEQIPEVQKQLQDIIQQRAMHNRGLTTDNTDGTDIKATGLNLSVSSVQSVVNLFLNPEELTLLDPACGSGHILVEAYDLFKSIYEERGYRSKDIPALILQKNLFGLEIDDRAAQLAAFALMMKARADYPRIFDVKAQPNVVSFVESKGLDAEEIHYSLMSPMQGEKQNTELPRPDGFLFETENNLFTHAAEVKAAQTIAKGSLPDITKEDIASLVTLFENAKTFGSLIQVPPKLTKKLPDIAKRLVDVLTNGDLTHSAARVLEPLLHQAKLLARKYDAVVANPPYMGSKFFSPTLKDFIIDYYKDAKADLYACFIQQNVGLSQIGGRVGMITIPNWMFLSSFEGVRRNLLERQAIDTFVHNGRGVFGSDFGSCSFVIQNLRLPTYRGTFCRLFDKQGSVASNEELANRFSSSPRYLASNSDFARVPGVPISYWVSDSVKAAFEDFPPLSQIADVRVGMHTGSNIRFVRQWFEVSIPNLRIGCESEADTGQYEEKWYPYNKGGEFRKWEGNRGCVVNWKNRGREIHEFHEIPMTHNGAPVRAKLLQFKESITWSFV